MANIRKLNLWDRVKQCAQVAALTVAPAIITPAIADKAHAEPDAKKTVKTLRVDDAAEVPDTSLRARAYGTTSKTSHKIGTNLTFNPSELIDLEHFPVLFELDEGLRYRTGKNDARFWEQSCKLRLGLDTGDLESADGLRLTLMPHFAYHQQRDLSGDASTRLVGMYEIGGSATAAMNALGGQWRLALDGGVYFDAGNGEMKMRDSFGDRVELDASGSHVGANLLHVRPMPGIANLLGADPKSLKLILGAGGNYHNQALEAVGDSTNGRIKSRQVSEGGSGNWELGAYHTGLNLGASLVGRHGVESVRLSNNYGVPRSSDSEQTNELGLRLYLAVPIKDKRLNLSGQVLVDVEEGEAQGSLSATYDF